MSFIITLYVREGIVMAADSRLTLTTQREELDKKVVNLAVGQSDSNYKLFLAPHDIGISTYGAADIKGVPIGGYVDSFIATSLKEKPVSIEDVSQQLLKYFLDFEPIPKTHFHIAAYATTSGQIEPQVWHVDIHAKQVSRINPAGKQGASWGGESDILARLIQQVGHIDKEGKILHKFPHFQIQWHFFTLQDAIDFAVFALRSTIDAMRFQPRAKTVGGPIDVLVIKPTGAIWVQRKALRVES